MREHRYPEATPVRDNHIAQGIGLISALDIIVVIRAETIRVGAAKLRLSPEDARTHSLYSGGAMAMHIAGVPYRTLVSIGRWRLLGFMVYIQQQISSFSTGVSVNMRQQPWF